MREIPPLQTLCLRAVGSYKCSAEKTFRPRSDGTPSAASRLLRSLHQRPVVATEADYKALEVADRGHADDDVNTMEYIPLKRTPCIGNNSARRMQANDVDLNLPMTACQAPDGALVTEYGSPALDCLQSYIDALVELGRMDDARLLRHFFAEWRCNVQLAAAGEADANAPSPKRRRTLNHNNNNTASPALGALSLYNCTISHDTMDAMLVSQMGPHLAVLDLTGVHGLHDDMLAKLLPTCVHLRRLSLKNCRRVTVQSLRTVAQYQARLECLDVGGAFNIAADDVLEVLPTLAALHEIHASGLGWTDESIHSLVELRQWTKLSLGFSLRLTPAALRQALIQVADTLVSVALPFCESAVDNALLGMLGRNLPNVQYLDVRGNSYLSTLTGWYDGRASADLPAQALHVLGRFSGLSESSVEETRRVHPVEAALLTVILDASGSGTGITRLLEL